MIQLSGKSMLDGKTSLASGRPSRLGNVGIAGLTRAEVLAILLGVGIIASVAFNVLGLGEARRSFACKNRMRELSEAFAQFANDNGDALPAGVIDYSSRSNTWDKEIARYLVKGVAIQEGTNALETLTQRVGWLFHCPSDTEPRGGAAPRSYSMPMYDIRREGWPPDKFSRGGVGLYIDEERYKLARQANPGAPADFVPQIRTSMVPAPAETALLVERISIRNALWGATFACILGPREQWDAKTIERDKFHRGKFNYLMLDGHVESMTERESGGHTGSGGVWTIRVGD